MMHEEEKEVRVLHCLKIFIATVGVVAGSMKGKELKLMR